MMTDRMLRLMIFSLLCSLVWADTCEAEGSKEDGCPIMGNGDFYGLGVRIGICMYRLLARCLFKVY